MLSSQNSGKYASGIWHEDKYLAGREVDNFTSDQLAFLEMDGVLEAPLGKLDVFDRTMQMKTIPVGFYDEERDYDWRCNPEVG